jgi:ADP-ribose pyrophosphatase YjhB (NUDIX family)
MADKKISLGVFMYIFNNNFSRVLLLKLNEEKMKKSGANWGNVGGKMHPGEKSIDACIREGEEEIGVRFIPEELRFLYVKENPDFSDHIYAVHFVYATRLDEGRKISLSKELSDYSWFCLDSLPNKTLDSVTDFHRAAKLAKREFE